MSLGLSIPADHPSIRELGREEITTISITVTMPDLSSQVISVMPVIPRNFSMLITSFPD